MDILNGELNGRDESRYDNPNEWNRIWESSRADAIPDQPLNPNMSSLSTQAET